MLEEFLNLHFESLWGHTRLEGPHEPESTPVPRNTPGSLCTHPGPTGLLPKLSGASGLQERSCRGQPEPALCGQLPPALSSCAPAPLPVLCYLTLLLSLLGRGWEASDPPGKQRVRRA